MRARLAGRGLAAFLTGMLAVGLLVFLPAGTLRYPCGWLFCGILFLPMFLMGIVLLIKNPSLLEKRLSAKEQRGEQKEVILKSGLMFIAAFVLAGLNFRFGWLSLPNWVVWAASVLFLLAYLMWGEVLRENAFNVSVPAEKKEES